MTLKYVPILNVTSNFISLFHIFSSLTHMRTTLKQKRTNKKKLAKKPYPPHARPLCMKEVGAKWGSQDDKVPMGIKVVAVGLFCDHFGTLVPFGITPERLQYYTGSHCSRWSIFYLIVDNLRKKC